MQEVISKNQCLHCTSAIPNTTQGNFCCLGCKTAYNYINSLNLKNYYNYCRNIYKVAPKKVEEIEDNITYTEYVEEINNKLELNLLIDGIVCGSCIWLIENTLEKRFPNISARLNLSNSRLKIVWPKNKKLAKEYVDEIRKIGFTPYPFDAKLANFTYDNKQKTLLRSIAISGLAATNVMAFSLASWFGDYSNSIDSITQNIFNILATLIAVPLISIASKIFFSSAFNALRHGKFNMDVPIAIAILLSLLISIFNTFTNGEHTYYEAACMLTFVLLIGRYLEVKSRQQAADKIRDISLKQPNSVKVLYKNKVKLINIRDAKIGDIILVNQGERIALDGVIVAGKTQLDTSIITGESIFKEAKINSKVYAGSINIGTPIKIKVAADFKNSSLQQIINLLHNNSGKQGKFQKLSDLAAKLYSPLVLSLSSCNFIIWYFLLASNFNVALNNAIALLIITCPCALGISVPVAHIVSNTKLLQKKIFIKNSDIFEKITQTNHVVFDKTGTLTIGQMNWLNHNDFSSDEQQLIASIAIHSSHPLCKAISNSFSATLLNNISVTEHPGQGLQAKYKNKIYHLGNKAFCDIKDTYKDQYVETFFNNKRLIFADKIRDDAKIIIKELKKEHIKITLLSGDKKENVINISKQLQIADYKYNQLPTDKYEYINSTCDNILMVGDGVNDSPALKRAFISASLADGADIACSNADIVLGDNKLSSLLTVQKTAKLCVKVIKQNIGFSLLYNIITIPIAFCGYVHPVIAAAAMSSSSIIVILNSLRINAKS